MAEHLADDLERHAVHDRVAGDRMPQVMQADVGDAGHFAHETPGRAQSVELVSAGGANGEPLARVALGLGDAAEQVHDLVGDVDVPLASPGVRQAQDGPSPVDLLPAQVADLVATPISIGLSLTLIHLISIPVTNTSVNPARSTATALFAGAGALEQLWLFWAAPIVGGVLGGALYGWLGRDEPDIVGKP